MPQQSHQFLPPIQLGTAPGAVGLAGRARDFHPLAGSLRSAQESILAGGFGVLVLPCDTGPALTQPPTTLVPGIAPGSGPPDHPPRQLPLPVMNLGGRSPQRRCLRDAGWDPSAMARSRASPSPHWRWPAELGKPQPVSLQPPAPSARAVTRPSAGSGAAPVGMGMMCPPPCPGPAPGSSWPPPGHLAVPCALPARSMLGTLLEPSRV